MGIFMGTSGMLKIRLISANTVLMLNELSSNGVQVRRVRHIDGLTVEFWVNRSDMHMLHNIVQRNGDRMEILYHQGIYWRLKRFIKRPVLVAGIIFLLFLTAYLPSKVLFIHVEGNVDTPTRFILEAAEESGIRFGASTRKIRSEKVKNMLLQRIPQLQWAGINTQGCVAVISVREKTVVDTPEYKYPISSLVAARDGYITEMTAISGTPACKVGQSVKKGQVLISAYTDCGIYLQATKAEGEVYAMTKHQFDTVALTKISQKGSQTNTYQNYGLIIGKKQINFTKDSGISSAECDRIKSVNYVTLPGGFRLPIAFVSETVSERVLLESEIDEQQSQSLLRGYSQQYLKDSMIGGKIDSIHEQFDSHEGVCVMTGKYQCNEMIGISRTEEILQNYEQDSRTVH